MEKRSSAYPIANQRGLFRARNHKKNRSHCSSHAGKAISSSIVLVALIVVSSGYIFGNCASVGSMVFWYGGFNGVEDLGEVCFWYDVRWATVACDFCMWQRGNFRNLWSEFFKLYCMWFRGLSVLVLCALSNIESYFSLRNYNYLDKKSRDPKQMFLYRNGCIFSHIW